MTSLWDVLRVAAILGPIGLMLVVGLFLTLRSGVARLATPEGLRRGLVNASQTVILLAGCLVGLAVIQHFVGLPVAISW